MAIERLIALQVTDDKMYNLHREKMFPILQKYNGDFGYDFKIAEVLKNETNKLINRVFTIHFRSEDEMESFFSDDEYLIIKHTYFTPSVSSAIEIARYQKKALTK